MEHTIKSMSLTNREREIERESEERESGGRNRRESLHTRKVGDATFYGRLHASSPTRIVLFLIGKQATDYSYGRFYCLLHLI